MTGMMFIILLRTAGIANQEIKGTETNRGDQQAEAAEYAQCQPCNLIVNQAFINKAKIKHDQADTKPDAKINEANIALYCHTSPRNSNHTPLRLCSRSSILKTGNEKFKVPSIIFIIYP